MLAGPEKRWSTFRTRTFGGGARLRGADGGAGGVAAPPARLPEGRSFADTGRRGSVDGCCLGGVAVTARHESLRGPDGDAWRASDDGGAGGVASRAASPGFEGRAAADTGRGGSVGGCCLGAWAAATEYLRGIEDIGGG